MIKHNTVFILGAGASIPYDFPSGYDLLNRICKALEQNNSVFFRLIQSCGFDQNLISEFRHELYHSMQKSVDAFLEKRTEFIDVGKAAIAATLIPFEQEQKLFRLQNKPNWYEYLFNLLADKKEDFPENQVSIITYNYDRSFEHFMFTALKHSYNLDSETAADMLNSMPIYHIHGKLGDLPHLGDEVIPYNYVVENKLHPAHLKICIRQIKIIHELEEDTTELIKTRKLLSESNRIFFLGFGYHILNIKRLMKDFKVNAFVTNRFMGTAFGVEQGERNAIHDYFKENYQSKISFGEIKDDVLTFLRKSNLH